MKHQALFSSKDKSKKLKCRLLQFLFGALRVKTWCYSNGMHINIGKKSVMKISSCSKLSLAESIELFLHDELVKEVDNQKLRGVIIDKTMGQIS